LGNTFNFGVSAAQNPAALNSSGSILGGGGINNGQSFASFVQNVITGSSNSSGYASSPVTTVTSSLGTNGGAFASALPGGMSYFGNIGPNWDVAVNAAESDSHASIIQRPRIQTSQAKPAQFFVGDTVPYVTSSTYGTAITGVGNVPNTIKRTLNASITVRDRDTVMLGGFIKSDKSHSQSGVPFLSDIPWLGNLFKQRSDSKDRQELIVLMRPTVLKTPELAAKHAVNEEQRLPGVSEAAAEDAAYERTLIDAQRKRELKKFKNTKQADGFFVPVPEAQTTNAMTAPVDDVTPPAVLPPSAAVAAPLDPAAKQQAAAAALAQKMMELNSTNAPH
jgi:type II secretory pathway component GspD/PulD (secretin)